MFFTKEVLFNSICTHFNILQIVNEKAMIERFLSRLKYTTIL
ncbi:hypothetical protein E0Y62_02715 [Cytobacillus praedii]|uniref:Histone deacetylase complex subunit SAP30 Sin3 binding domain-containing protein n=1 Tax=Cytobacillus praedii TaxID=1742358 RepID=A0A4R1B6N2_9BACI|nr:hypothetical protein E0Y62_02715 [Cytobacillus praedii]